MKLDFTGPIDIIFAFLWLVIILAIAHSRRSKNSLDPHYKYYLPNVYFKLLFGFLFACVYLFYYDGGDTTAYWQGAITLNNLFFKSPVLYFDELFAGNQHFMISTNFDLQTGFPPGWIYREPEGWFVSKVASLLSFITFKSYFAATFLVSFILANASWKIFEMVREFNLHKESHVAIASLFIPSVAFWCGSVSKDSIVLIAIFYLIYNAFNILNTNKKATFKNYLIILFCLFLILSLRSVVAMAVILPLFFSYTVRIKNKYKNNLVLSHLLRGGLYLLGAFAFVYFLSTQAELLESYITEASVIQQDFSQNKTYGDKKYDLGITDYSPAGMMRVFPKALIAGTYQPFVWEALNPTLILNGLESLFAMYLTFLFMFKGNVFKKIRSIFNNEFMIFALFFVILMGFMAGFTAVLFGVLVRFKAPVMVFLFLLITASNRENKESTT